MVGLGFLLCLKTEEALFLNEIFWGLVATVWLYKLKKDWLICGK
jgi:hypothetical protein